MLGVIFTEMIDMIEDRYGVTEPERLLQILDPPSGGAYTSLGNYPAAELVGLLGVLIDEHGGTAEEWLRAFGHHLFPRLAAGHPKLLAGITGSFDFLKGIETVVHTRVRSLYPGAEVPFFEVESRAADTLILHYRSERGLAALAVGLLEGCFEHFGERVELTSVDHSEGKGRDVTFTLRRTA